MEVSVKRVMGWDIAVDDARFTVHTGSLGKEPSVTWQRRACLAEHSVIRDVRFIVEIKDIPCWCSQHIARHDAFADHTVRESKETHFVATSRTDRTGIDRNKLPQDALVDHRISLSAEDLITISRRRLCNCASKETMEIWMAVVEAVRKVDPVVASCCVPNCVYRGRCPEMQGCGWDKSEAFKSTVEAYWV